MSGGTVGQFQYGHLNSTVSLGAGSTYWVVSQETNGEDTWYDHDTVITTTDVATENGGAWGGGLGDWHLMSALNRSYGPVDFKHLE
jgi:hypothetical protein